MIDEIENFLNESLMQTQVGISELSWRPNLTRIYLNEVYEECRQLIKKIIKLSNHNNDCALLSYMPNCNKVLTDLRRDVDELKEKYAPFFFITINSKDEHWKEVLDSIKSMSNWKCVEKGFFVVETRGFTCEGAPSAAPRYTGIHYHILINKHNIALSTMKRKIQNKFKKFIGDGELNALLNVQLKEYKYLKDKMDYIMGKNKYGIEKQEKQELDIKFRKEEHLPDYWSFEGLVTDKNPQISSPSARVGATLVF